MMLCQYSYFTTIQYSNAGIATVIQYLHLVIILLLVCMQRRTLPRPIEMLSLVLALGGTFLLATHGRLNTLVLSGTALIWGLISAGACVFYTLYPANLMKQFDTTLIVGWGMFLGGLVLTLLMRPWTQNVILDGQTFLAFAVIVFFGTILAFSFYLLGVKLIGPLPCQHAGFHRGRLSHHPLCSVAEESL